MKTPIERFNTYGAEQWREITKVLANLEINANTFMVDSKHPLREWLENHARWYRAFTRWPLLRRTPKQKVEELKGVLAEIEAVERRFARVRLGDAASYAPRQRSRAAVAVLQELARPLQLELEKEATATQPQRNASKGTLWAYLGELGKVWDQIKGSRQAQRKLKIDFLLACAAPTFGTNKKTIENFLDRHPKSSD